MQRVSLSWLLNVSHSIEQISELREGTIEQSNSWALFGAKLQLEALFQSVYAHYLRASLIKAEELYAKINQLLDALQKPDAKLSEWEIFSIRNARDDFKTVWHSELSTLPSFLVSGKESYETNTLIDNGQRLFPSSLSQRTPEAISDAREVGKALAYELATSCGFHIFRVVEAVTKRYWDHASNGANRPKLQTLGQFASEMERLGIGDTKIVESMKQMTKLHRNPIIHPEVILSVDEAIDTLGIARSVVGAMLRSLPDVPLTTAIASAAPASNSSSR